MKYCGKVMVLILLVLFVVSCAPVAPQAGGASPFPTNPSASVPKNDEKAANGGTLVRAMTTEPATVDPQGAPNSGLSLVIPYLFDTLVVRDVHNQLLPQLAESWQVAQDGKAITMKLRSGVTFHDGTALDAEAVRFTFQRFKETGQKSPIYSGIQQIAGIEAIDNLNVRFSFKEPAANFWSTISMPYAGILSPLSARKALESKSKEQLVGSGPFMLGEWKAGQLITLKRNPDYKWGPALTENQGAPYLDAIVFKVIPEATTQLAALTVNQIGALDTFQVAAFSTTQLRAMTATQFAALSADAIASMPPTAISGLSLAQLTALRGEARRAAAASARMPHGPWCGR